MAADRKTAAAGALGSRRRTCCLVAAALLLAAVPAAWAAARTGQQQREHRRLLAAVAALTPDSEYIVIDTHDNRLALRLGRADLLDVPCATGSGRRLEGDKSWYRWTFSTPTGRRAVIRKVANPLWVRPTWDFVETDEDVPVFAEDPRRFERGILGEYAIYFAQDFMIHGALYEINLGKNITHGCVRVAAEPLTTLYHQVQLGCPVYIY